MLNATDDSLARSTHVGDGALVLRFHNGPLESCGLRDVSQEDPP